jgi:hypothetical protein
MKTETERINDLHKRIDALWPADDTCLGRGVRLILEQSEAMSSWEYRDQNALISVVEEYLYLLEKSNKEQA